MATMVIRDGSWHANIVTSFEAHPELDLALLRTVDPRPAPIVVSFDRHFGSAPYMQWSYPQDVAYELVLEQQAFFRPDLVYLEGYVRRRMTDISLPLPGAKELYELSTPAGEGASGSAVIARRPVGPGRPWQIIGIYIGERQTEAFGRPQNVGYATRLDACHNWRPAIAGGGRTLAEL